MIKNRNVALDAGISPAKIAGAGFADIRLTRYVCAANSGAYYRHLQDSVASGMLYETVTLALADCGKNERIIVYPGDYDEGAVLEITSTHEGLEIIGPGNGNQHQAMIYSSSASHHLMTIDAHHVTIDGLGFTQTKDTYDGIIIGSGTATFKTTIRNCRFDGYGAGEYGIDAGNTHDAPDIVIEDNVFRSWQTAGVLLYATRGIARRNLVHNVASKIGIDLSATGGNRPGLFVYENYVLGVNSSDTGIDVSAVSAGTLHLSNNYCVGHGTADITQFANGQYSGTENYAASTAGGAIIDIDS